MNHIYGPEMMVLIVVVDFVVLAVLKKDLKKKKGIRTALVADGPGMKPFDLSPVYMAQT